MKLLMAGRHWLGIHPYHQLMSVAKDGVKCGH